MKNNHQTFHWDNKGSSDQGMFHSDSFKVGGINQDCVLVANVLEKTTEKVKLDKKSKETTLRDNFRVIGRFTQDLSEDEALMDGLVLKKNVHEHKMKFKCDHHAHVKAFTCTMHFYYGIYAQKL